MYVTIEEEPKKAEVTLCAKIPNGTMFTGNIKTYEDKLFYKFDDVILSLDQDHWPARNLGNSWCSQICPVYNFKLVKSIHVTV
jgi:hypothetical protein